MCESLGENDHSKGEVARLERLVAERRTAIDDFMVPQGRIHTFSQLLRAVGGCEEGVARHISHLAGFGGKGQFAPEERENDTKGFLERMTSMHTGEWHSIGLERHWNVDDFRMFVDAVNEGAIQQSWDCGDGGWTCSEEWSEDGGRKSDWSNLPASENEDDEDDRSNSL